MQATIVPELEKSRSREIKFTDLIKMIRFNAIYGWLLIFVVNNFQQLVQVWGKMLAKLEVTDQ